jgi:hypothetical protein
MTCDHLARCWLGSGSLPALRLAMLPRPDYRFVLIVVIFVLLALLGDFLRQRGWPIVRRVMLVVLAIRLGVSLGILAKLLQDKRSPRQPDH